MGWLGDHRMVADRVLAYLKFIAPDAEFEVDDSRDIYTAIRLKGELIAEIDDDEAYFNYDDVP